VIHYDGVKIECRLGMMHFRK